MSKLKHLQDAKRHVLNRKPRYGLRKLSIGLVSCALGYMTLYAPETVLAANEPSETPASQPLPEDRSLVAPTETPASQPVNGDGALATPTEVSEESKGKLAEDEAKIANYSDKERYRTSEMEGGNGVVKNLTNEEKGEMKEGFKYNSQNPKTTDEDKKTYGIEVEVDKAKSKRTYTYIGVSDSKNPAPVKNGTHDALANGEKLIKDPITYQPKAKLKVNGSTLKITFTEEDLKHVNSKDNKKTLAAWEDKYRHNLTNPKNQYFNGDNFRVTFAVNPYPNENDALAVMKVETEKQSHDKYFVKGQLIRTGAYISNILKGDQSRIAGEVYHPDGTYLKDAQAFIITDENIEQYKKELNAEDLKVGEIIFKMPKGALDDPNSVFNTDKFRGIQNLKVKMYARPRTGEEFKAALPTFNEDTEEGKIVPGKKDVIGADGEVEEEAPRYGVNGRYTGPVDGTKEITHNGKKVTIDKQGIDRYDHYNVLGDLTINLDDTKDHDQVFDTKVDKPTDKMTAVKPDKPVEININDNFEKKPNDPRESAASMNELKKEGKTKAEFDKGFLEKAKAEGWEIKIADGDISKFTVKAPKTAKAGEFIAIPLTYTYTNGSNDTHWFHFVVQDTDNNKPEYYAPVGIPGESLSNTPILTPNPKKYEPQGYELDGTEFKDDKGNVWNNVKVDPKTGVVTADVPDNGKIVGGERLFVPVKIKYIDPKTQEEKFEYVKAEFVAKPKFQTEVTTSVDKDIPFDTEEKIDENLPAGEILVDEPGEVGKATVSFKQVVVNGKKGIIDENGKFVAGDDKFIKEEKVTKEKKNRKVRVGVKPIEEKVVIPHTTEYEFDDSIESGKEVIVENGEDGEVTVKTTKDPKTGKVTVSQAKTKEAKARKIKVGTKTVGELVDTDPLPFKFTVEKDPSLKKGEYKIVKEGTAGSITKTWTITNSKIDGDPTIKRVEPVDGLVKVGDSDFTGKVTHDVTEEVPFDVEIIEDENLEPGKSEIVTPGKPGSKTTTYSQAIKNGEADGPLESKVTKEVKPVKQVIRVGKKSLKNQDKQDKDIPVNIEYVYDKDKPKGFTKTGELTPGKVETVVTNQYNPATGKIETKTELVVTPAKQKIIVGVKDYTGKVEDVIDHVIPYDTEIKVDNTLPAGEKVIDNPGENGHMREKVTQHILNGHVDGTVNSAVETTKKPVNRVLRVGTLTEGKHSHTEEIPFGYTVEYDPELASGEYKVVTPGTKGSRTTEWTIKNSKVDGQAKVTETKPVNAVIKVGKKDFTGEFKTVDKNPIPFEVEYKIDPNLKAGEEVVDQEGALGEEETTITHKIKNGQVESSVQGEKKQSKVPVKKIVRIGAKTDGTYVHKEEVPFEVEVRVNQDLPAGEHKVLQQGEKGEKTTTVKVENSKVVGEAKVETTKEAKKHIIEIGTKPAVCPLPQGTETPIDQDVPVEVEFVYDATKDKGFVEKGKVTKGKTESKVVSKVVNGKVVNTVETVVTPAKQKIIVGTKDLTGEYKYSNTCPVPYPVIVRENKDLPAGTTKVVQAGLPGSKETHYIQKLKNGKADGDPRITEGKYVEPKAHIIEVGTKVVVASSEPSQVDPKADEGKTSEHLPEAHQTDKKSEKLAKKEQESENVKVSESSNSEKDKVEVDKLSSKETDPLVKEKEASIYTSIQALSKKNLPQTGENSSLASLTLAGLTLSSALAIKLKSGKKRGE